MWVQRLTTKEPDESMIEVAIAAVEAVFDWRDFRSEKFPENVEREKAQEEIDAAIAGEDKGEKSDGL